LEAEGDRVPPIYRAVVEAGLRAGRLPTALEGLAGFARGFAEMRRAIGLALLYPSVVLLAAYAMFVAFAVRVAPRFFEAFASLRVPGTGLLRGLATLGAWVPVWGLVVPVLLALVWIAWLEAGRSNALRSGGIGGWLRRIPGLGAMLTNSRAAGFAGLLALLLEHRVPFAEAVELAAGASGDAAMIRSARGVAEAARRGDSARDSLGRDRAGPFPPLLRWLIATGERQGNLVPALKHAAESYRRRALHQAEAARVALPTLLLILIGAGATLLYALTLFVPLTTLLNGLVP
jgi:general secretion pathway protein F